MKLYTSIGPNPHVVTMFMAEKGITLPTQTIDLMGGENRKPEHVARNPAGQSPTLELDDGTMLSEITAICEYLEEKHPTPALIGATPEERAVTRMWTRRIDLNIIEPMTTGFRSSEGKALFESRMRLIPHAADDLKTIAREKLTWLDGLVGDNQWICGDRFSLADILLYCFMAFGAQVGQPLSPDNKALTAWMGRVSERASVKTPA